MIAANHLPKFDNEQLINANKMSLIEHSIVSANSLGFKVACVNVELTANEETYLTLYGYRAFSTEAGTGIFWTR